MTEPARGAGVELFTVVQTMNHQGATTVQRTDDGATYHVVEYRDTDVRDRLADASHGASVRLNLRRAGARANVWEATRILPGTDPAATTGDVSATSSAN